MQGARLGTLTTDEVRARVHLLRQLHTELGRQLTTDELTELFGECPGYQATRKRENSDHARERKRNLARKRWAARRAAGKCVKCNRRTDGHAHCGQCRESEAIRTAQAKARKRITAPSAA